MPFQDEQNRVVPLPSRGPEIQRPRLAIRPSSGRDNGGLTPGTYYLASKLRNWALIDPQVLLQLRRLHAISTETLSSTIMDRKIALVACGAAYAYSITQDGGRHISSVYYPGDIVNYGALLNDHCPHTICGNGVRFDLIDLALFRSVIESLPSMWWLLSRYENARTNFIVDRFCAAIRSEAVIRVSRLLLELKALDALTGMDRENRLQIRFTQRELGDMVGLTPVYVSKKLSQLERNGTIRRAGDIVEFVDRPALERECGFNNYFLSLSGGTFAGSADFVASSGAEA